VQIRSKKGQFLPQVVSKIKITMVPNDSQATLLCIQNSILEPPYFKIADLLRRFPLTTFSNKKNSKLLADLLQILFDFRFRGFLTQFDTN
jgi:hypothetical protein